MIGDELFTIVHSISAINFDQPHCGVLLFFPFYLGSRHSVAPLWLQISEYLEVGK